MAFFSPQTTYVQPVEITTQRVSRSRSPHNLGQVEIGWPNKGSTRTHSPTSTLNTQVITSTTRTGSPHHDFTPLEFTTTQRSLSRSHSPSHHSPNRPISPNMAMSNDPFVQAFFAIDVDNSEEITIDELRSYAQRNNLSSSFLEKWVRLFDKDHSGKITFEEFCRVLGLKQGEIRAMRRRTVQTIPGDRRRFPAGVSVLSADLSEEMQYDIIMVMISYMEKHNEREASKALKQYLDSKYNRLWHVVVLIGQFWAFYSHEPACSLHFKIGRHIFLLFKTPGF